ncbi:GDSL-type esterase/lipase family protein [Streptococcus massiliensis]|uniref:GDSL family lipase/acylhydrolase n=1 Tax=Streptococcus massiliensis TaxID=313439 RepID=A0A380L004_9STRE|nr:GDSL-type esterase/lipase family protein [Streptococcus massiliensis]SUN76674.1 GDSL family lipase/acylhydrolase [Streptococcus massiliensis]
MAVQLLDQWLLKEQKQMQENFRVLNQVGIHKPQVIFVGDSIIDYYPLGELLDTDKVMINRGIKGYKSHQILEHFSDHIFGENLEQVFLLIGTNDLALERPIAEIVENVELTVQMIQREFPHVEIALISVLPVNEEPFYRNTVHIRKNSTIEKLNQAYQDLAECTQQVTYISAYSQLLDNQNQLNSIYTVDGLHLSIAGYVELSKLVQNYLVK